MKRRGRPPTPGLLTPREKEVLDYIRADLTNPEIAERLAISVETVKQHVSEILSKPNVSTREAAAAWRPDERRRFRRCALVPLAVASFALLAAVAFLARTVFTSNGEASTVPTGRIAFVSDRDGDYDIWLLNADGTGLRKVTDFGDNPSITNLFWSPSGESLMFNENERLHVLDIASGLMTQVGDGEKLRASSFPKDDRIWVLIANDFVSMSLGGDDREIEWRDVPGNDYSTRILSPDGESLLNVAGYNGHQVASTTWISGPKWRRQKSIAGSGHRGVACLVTGRRSDSAGLRDGFTNIHVWHRDSAP